MSGTGSQFKWRHKRCLGLTLIEVLAALVIIGSSVTAILVAQSNSLDALTSSRRDLIAQHLAKELIANWELEEEDLRIDASGRISNDSDWSWSRSARGIRVADQIAATEIRLALVCRREAEALRPWRREFIWLIESKGE